MRRSARCVAPQAAAVACQETVAAPPARACPPWLAGRPTRAVHGAARMRVSFARGLTTTNGPRAVNGLAHDERSGHTITTRNVRGAWPERDSSMAPCVGLPLHVEHTSLSSHLRRLRTRVRQRASWLSGVRRTAPRVYEVSLVDVQRSCAACDWGDAPECTMLRALLDYGPVSQGSFNGSVRAGF